MSLLEPKVAHDFDGAVAVGEWIFCERVGHRVATKGGVVIPDSAQIPIWVAASVGPEVERKLGRKLPVGSRLLFCDPKALLTNEDRGFAIVHADNLVAILKMPELDEGVRIVAPSMTLAGALQ